jgi:hypothetical protein
MDLSDLTIDDIKLHTRGNITSSNTYWKEFYFTLNGKKYRIEFRAFEDGTPFYFRWEDPTPITPYRINKFYEFDNGWKLSSISGSSPFAQHIVTELLKKEKAYKLKKTINPSTAKSFEDLINEL